MNINKSMYPVLKITPKDERHRTRSRRKYLHSRLVDITIKLMCHGQWQYWGDEEYKNELRVRNWSKRRKK